MQPWEIDANISSIVWKIIDNAKRENLRSSDVINMVTAAKNRPTELQQFFDVDNQDVANSKIKMARQLYVNKDGQSPLIKYMTEPKVWRKFLATLYNELEKTKL